MSKSSKTCQHIFKQGKNKGKRCGKPCQKDKVCGVHNETTIKYQKEYQKKRYDEKKIKSTPLPKLQTKKLSNQDLIHFYDNLIHLHDNIEIVSDENDTQDHIYSLLVFCLKKVK